MPIYNYATTTLQNEQITELNNLNKNIENTNGLLALIGTVLVLQYFTSFIRNIF